jgi:hypothetical protein
LHAGTSGPRLLDNGQRNFQRGATDEFVLVAKELGNVRQAVVWHDGGGGGRGGDWGLDQIVVSVPATGRRYFFAATAWLQKVRMRTQQLRSCAA